jgi:prepilin-type N-terminal cleavage/methylation domain-containing protein
MMGMSSRQREGPTSSARVAGRRCRDHWNGRGGFTLIELLAVMAIIGIILSLVLIAGMEAANRANERATQTLITKLDGGLSDRLEALLQTRPDYNNTHLALANIYYSGTNAPITSITRAQVIAWYDYIKAEVPDVFVLQSDKNYPLNFTGVAVPGTDNSGSLGTYANYVLPLGNTLVGSPSGIGDGNQTSPYLGFAGTGIFGASYTAAAGIYKNISAGGITYQPIGYDGVDNNGNGLVDEISEGIPLAANQTLFLNALPATHKHNTARSEMLYALLVEGRGPLGSVFSADDFTTKEVQDTDGDGLPEFVDAWGQPLQFFRWPLLYHSDIQRGQVVTNTGGTLWTLGQPYASIYETREQDLLDPNQQLMAPAWWFASFNGAAPGGFTGVSQALGVSHGVLAFETYFHRLSEPDPYAKSNFALYWDRSSNPGYGSRRAFYSKFLILSGGPDLAPGVFLYSDLTLAKNSAADAAVAVQALIANENNAMPFALDVADFTKSATLSNVTIPVNTTNPSSDDPTNPNSYDLQQAAQDDISNQNLSAVGGIGGSG